MKSLHQILGTLPSIEQEKLQLALAQENHPRLSDAVAPYQMPPLIQKQIPRIIIAGTENPDQNKTILKQGNNHLVSSAKYDLAHHIQIPHVKLVNAITGTASTTLEKLAEVLGFDISANLKKYSENIGLTEQQFIELHAQYYRAPASNHDKSPLSIRLAQPETNTWRKSDKGSIIISLHKEIIFYEHLQKPNQTVYDAFENNQFIQKELLTKYIDLRHKANSIVKSIIPEKTYRIEHNTLHVFDE